MNGEAVRPATFEEMTIRNIAWALEMDIKFWEKREIISRFLGLSWTHEHEMREQKANNPDTRFLNFLYNVINPNEMEQYISMYHAEGIAVCGEPAEVET